MRSMLRNSAVALASGCAVTATITLALALMLAPGSTVAIIVITSLMALLLGWARRRIGARRADLRQADIAVQRQAAAGIEAMETWLSIRSRRPRHDT